MENAEKIYDASLIIKEELHQFIEEMNEYQAKLVSSFVKTLFGLTD